VDGGSEAGGEGEDDAVAVGPPEIALAQASQISAHNARVEFIWHHRIEGGGRKLTVSRDEFATIAADAISEEDQDQRAIYQRPEIIRNYKLALTRYLETPDMPVNQSYAPQLLPSWTTETLRLRGRGPIWGHSVSPSRIVGLGLQEEIPKMMQALVR
jgi:hypothetical protein